MPEAKQDMHRAAPPVDDCGQGSSLLLRKAQTVSIPDFRFKLKPHYEKSHALLIGINQYENVSPLSYAVNDAQGIREVLINDLGFPAENIVSLFDQQATKRNILESFAKFH